MAQGPGCVISRTTIGKEPGEDLESGQARKADSAGPLCWLDGPVELVAV